MGSWGAVEKDGQKAWDKERERCETDFLGLEAPFDMENLGFANWAWPGEEQEETERVGVKMAEGIMLGVNRQINWWILLSRAWTRTQEPRVLSFLLLSEQVYETQWQSVLCLLGSLLEKDNFILLSIPLNMSGRHLYGRYKDFSSSNHSCEYYNNTTALNFSLLSLLCIKQK